MEFGTNGITMIIIKQASDGQHYFVVKSANGKVIATSETYHSKRHAQKGVEALLRAIGGEDTVLLAKINEYLKNLNTK